MLRPGDRATYSREQVSKYLGHLNRRSNSTFILEQLEQDIKDDPLAALGELQRITVAVVPWGNVALHYSVHRTITLDPDALFEKIVDRGQGGYCMENNGFFSTVLRSLGYQLYVTGARISNAVDGRGDPNGFQGWQHMVILLTLDAKTYHVDTGFGSQNPLRPILLQDGEVEQNVPGSEGRLVHRTVADNVSDQKLWVYETRNASAKVWSPAYCFSELEFWPQDFRIINYRTSHDPQSWFTYKFVLTRVLIDESGTATGTVTIADHKVTRRMGDGQSETLVECQTEEDRIEALERWFGIVLKEHEKMGIKGMASEIRS